MFLEIFHFGKWCETMRHWQGSLAAFFLNSLATLTALQHHPGKILLSLSGSHEGKRIVSLKGFRDGRGWDHPSVDLSEGDVVVYVTSPDYGFYQIGTGNAHDQPQVGRAAKQTRVAVITAIQIVWTELVANGKIYGRPLQVVRKPSPGENTTWELVEAEEVRNYVLELARSTSLSRPFADISGCSRHSFQS